MERSCTEYEAKTEMRLNECKKCRDLKGMARSMEEEAARSRNGSIEIAETSTRFYPTIKRLSGKILARRLSLSRTY